MKPYNTTTKQVTVALNGALLDVNVTVKAYYDECFELDWDFQPGEKEKLERQINRGDVTPTGIVVEASYNGIEASDSLWGVLVAHESDIQDTVNDHGMESNAIAALKERLLDLAKDLQKLNL